jgi:hypothetical protein
MDAPRRRTITGDRVPRELIERRMPWPRDRHWRPGEPMTISESGTTVTYRLRGVMRDTEPDSHFATVTLEPIRAIETDEARLSAAG